MAMQQIVKMSLRPQTSSPGENEQSGENIPLSCRSILEWMAAGTKTPISPSFGHRKGAAKTTELSQQPEDQLHGTRTDNDVDLDRAKQENQVQCREEPVRLREEEHLLKSDSCSAKRQRFEESGDTQWFRDGPTTLENIERIFGADRQQGNDKTKREELSWSVSSVLSGERAATAWSDAVHSPALTQQGAAIDTWISSWIDAASDKSSITPPIQHDTDKHGQIFYPGTFQTLHEGPLRDHRDMAWRQLNMTSELMIVREIKARKDLAGRLRQKALLDEQRLSEKLNSEAVSPVLEESQWPRADCMIRPAKEEDLDQIAAIINLEREQERCPQILEPKTVTSLDVKKIYRYCEINLRPFVVALPWEEDFADRSKWPKNSEKAYQEFLKFKQSQARKSAEVVGFAFVTESRVGFLNQPCPGSRFSGLVRLVVHPGHRRNLYGKALLDRILLSIDPFHASLVDHQWTCPNSSHIYERPASSNRRQYLRIYLECYAENKDSNDLKIISHVVKQFGFEQSAYLTQAVKTDRHYQSKWLDIAMWELCAQSPDEIVDKPPGYLR